MSFKSEITKEELADLAQPKLRLFLSVDVVGSTAFKHRSGHSDGQGWLEFFTSFYTEFPDFLAVEREKCLKKRGEAEDKLPKPTLWKALGDELIFTVVLTHQRQAETLLTAFRNAVARAITKYGHGENPLPISFKAAAWLAGFPVGNAAVPINANETEQVTRFDFVGPQIDIGFRISGFSTPRRLAVSVELALLVLVAGSTDLSFRYDGKRALRGVLSGRGYPVIWIDSYNGLDRQDQRLEHKLTEAEDKLTADVQQSKEDLKDFCTKYIEEIGTPLFVPFIRGNDDTTLVPPEGYEDEVQLVEQRLRKVFTVREGQAQDAEIVEDRIPEVEDWDPSE